ncbi:MAG: TlyA family RNA methyltransferase [Candidatus Coatesbacteria bacterium]|nr:TlyA family RNA methyltransferase [Candidatus Coatesbacteria bacterium]
MHDPRQRKQRIDRILVDRGLAESRQKAAALLMAGRVLVDGKLVSKAGAQVPVESSIDVKKPAYDFVSRAGDKLNTALDRFGVEIRGKVCMDIGASTGGFTECLLERGAKLVYAIDVGYGQLAHKLRIRTDVVPIERTNIRHFDGSALEYHPEFATIDVSFISLRLVLPKAFELLTENGEVVALIKPQFEVGKGQVGKGGIVRDVTLHRSVLQEIAEFSRGIGLHPAGITASSIRGQKGNQEYLFYGSKQAGPGQDLSERIEEALLQANSNEDTQCSRP